MDWFWSWFLTHWCSIYVSIFGRLDRVVGSGAVFGSSVVPWCWDQGSVPGLGSLWNIWGCVLGLGGGVGWGLSNTMMMRSEQNFWTWFQSDLGKSKCYNLGSWLCGVDVAALFLGRVLDFCWLWSFAQWFEIRFDLRFADPLLQGSPSYWRWFVWLWLYICAYRCRINWDDLSLWCC